MAFRSGTVEIAARLSLAALFVERSAGKAKPFRTSSGRAARTSKPLMLLVMLEAERDYVEDSTLWIAQHREATYVRNVGGWNVRAAAE
jgi:hypothetical protein